MFVYIFFVEEKALLYESSRGPAVEDFCQWERQAVGPPQGSVNQPEIQVGVCNVAKCHWSGRYVGVKRDQIKSKGQFKFTPWFEILQF